MTRRILGLPWNVSKHHRDLLPMPEHAVEYRLCQTCGSRNQFVTRDLSNPESQNHCYPSCAKARAQRGTTIDLRGEEAK